MSRKKEEGRDGRRAEKERKCGKSEELMEVGKGAKREGSARERGDAEGRRKRDREARTGRNLKTPGLNSN